MNAVDATGLTRRFGRFLAVEAVDLQVAPGEIVALVGANGAGKTTLVKLLLGLLRPSGGEVRLFGRRPDRAMRSRIGYVPQNLGLYPDLTVEENLRFRASVYGGSAERAAESGATTVPDRYRATVVGSIPLGIQRRVAFAAATGHRPDLLLLDEPTSGVSPLERSRLWDLIHTEAARGAAVVVSTHYLDEAEQADRVVILAGGRVVAAGTVAGVTGTRTVVEVDCARWADALAALDPCPWPLALDGRRVRVLGASVGEVSGALEGADLVATVRPVPATLDEVLIALDASGATAR